MENNNSTGGWNGLPPTLLIAIGLMIVSCHSLQKETYHLSNQDTTKVLQTVIDDFKPRWAQGFKGQPMRILPNRYIKPGTSIIINNRKVAYS